MFLQRHVFFEAGPARLASAASARVRPFLPPPLRIHTKLRNAALNSYIADDAQAVERREGERENPFLNHRLRLFSPHLTLGELSEPKMSTLGKKTEYKPARGRAQIRTRLFLPLPPSITSPPPTSSSIIMQISELPAAKSITCCPAHYIRPPKIPSDIEFQEEQEEDSTFSAGKVVVFCFRKEGQ